ncbi:hypothetical protein BY996DRAFT_7251262 [Phakopsora pachyrhizi]|nr:hypothetical protein BY996DRAFT_7251262 [Phakopsora pachyrhizi]
MIRGLRRSRLIISSLVIILILLLTNLSGLFPNYLLQAIFGQNTWLGIIQALRATEWPEFCYDPYRLPGHVNRSSLSDEDGDLFKLRYVVNSPLRSLRMDRISSALTSDLILPSISSQIVEDPTNPHLNFLRDRTLIFIGDSLDRNLVYQLSTEAFGTTNHRFLNSEDDPQFRHPATHSHRIGLGSHPTLRLTLSNWFLMSVDVESPKDFFHPGEDPPQNFEGRLESFYYPLMDGQLLSSSPDLIVFNSGLWDLVYLSGARDAEIARNRSMGVMSPRQVTGEPLTASELAHHEKRFRSLIITLRKRFPGPRTRLAYRTMPDSALGKADQNAMSRLRVRQIDGLNVKIIHSLNRAGTFVDIIDWAWAVRDLSDELLDLVHFKRGAAQWSLVVFFF